MSGDIKHQLLLTEHLRPFIFFFFELLRPPLFKALLQASCSFPPSLSFSLYAFLWRQHKKGPLSTSRAGKAINSGILVLKTNKTKQNWFLPLLLKHKLYSHPLFNGRHVNINIYAYWSWFYYRRSNISDNQHLKKMSRWYMNIQVIERLRRPEKVCWVIRMGARNLGWYRQHISIQPLTAWGKASKLMAITSN